MRAGAEYFVDPSLPAQRRYEALRAYFVEEATAAEAAARFGYSTSTLHQLAAELRAGRSEFFRSSKPGPKGPRKAGRIRDKVIALRAQDRSVVEIAAALHAEGSPVSAQTVWAIRTPRASSASGAEARAGRHRASSRSRPAR
jgi:plasmid stabilization system protein ParE